MKPELKALGTYLFTLRYDASLSSFPFKSNSRRYSLGSQAAALCSELGENPGSTAAPREASGAGAAAAAAGG